MHWVSGEGKAEQAVNPGALGNHVFSGLKMRCA